MAGHLGSAVAIITVDGEHGWNHFAGHQTLFVGEFVDHVEGFGDVCGASMTMVTTGTWRASLKQLVAVGFVVAVEAPDPAEHRGAAGRFPLPVACPQ